MFSLLFSASVFITHNSDILTWWVIKSMNHAYVIYEWIPTNIKEEQSRLCPPHYNSSPPRIFRPSYGPDLTRVTVNSTLTTALLVANKTETRFICLLLVFNDFWDVFTKYNVPLGWNNFARHGKARELSLLTGSCRFLRPNHMYQFVDHWNNFFPNGSQLFGTHEYVFHVYLMSGLQKNAIFFFTFWLFF